MRPCGFLNINKPRGISSRAVVDQTIWQLRTKVGHCGTLDPLASGVLVIAVGTARRAVEFVQDLPKTYLATVRLGATSLTDDAEGPITESAGATSPTQAQIEAALRSFVGEMEQVPPALSAIHTQGTRAHRMVRRGRTPQLAPRPVVIHRIELLQYEWPELEIEVECGKGAYIRALARDLGIALGCGGYIAGLERTRVGHFQVTDGIPWDLPKVELMTHLISIPEALRHLPRIELTPEQFWRLRHGQRVPLEQDWEQVIGAASWVLIYEAGSGLVIFAAPDLNQGVLSPRRALAMPI